METFEFSSPLLRRISKIKILEMDERRFIISDCSTPVKFIDLTFVTSYIFQRNFARRKWKKKKKEEQEVEQEISYQLWFERAAYRSLSAVHASVVARIFAEQHAARRTTRGLIIWLIARDILSRRPAPINSINRLLHATDRKRGSIERLDFIDPPPPPIEYRNHLSLFRSLMWRAWSCRLTTFVASLFR